MELAGGVAEVSVVARVVFTAGGVEYTWGDVVAAARLGGDWAAVQQEARRGLAGLADLSSRGEQVDPVELEGYGAAFRYERDLLSGDEMEAWLERWGLTSLEWKEWLSRALARERLAGQSDELVAELEPAADEVVTAAAVEAVCSGALERWARELAERAAVSLASGLHANPGPQPEPPPARGVLALAPSDWGVAVEKVAPLDLEVDEVLAHTITDAAVERELALHRLDWLSVECRRLGFAQEPMAREAVLCVRDDGWSLERVAAAAGVPLERTGGVVEDVSERMRSALLGGREGELVGPLEDDDEYVVMVVDAKREPEASDRGIEERARRRAAERAVRREVDARVRWHERI